eukprot:10157603-Prorocentrum_lima.AAC.1
MMAQLNRNMDIMSHTPPWHMVDLPANASYDDISSRFRKYALTMHPAKDFNTKILCKMAGYK